MRRLTLAAALVLVVLTAPGCKARAVGDDPAGSRPVEFLPLAGELEPGGEIESWLEVLRLAEGVYVRRDGEYRLVLVAMGKAPAAYEVVLNDISDAGDHVLLDVSYRALGPGDGAADPYPYLLLAVKTDREIVVEVLDIRSLRTPRRIHDHDAAKFSDLIVLWRPIPFESVGDTIRLAGRVKTDLAVYARVEDVEVTLLEETRLELAAAGDGWWEFDQEFSLRRGTVPYATVEIWFGTGDGSQSTVIPLRLRNWSPSSPPPEVVAIPGPGDRTSPEQVT